MFARSDLIRKLIRFTVSHDQSDHLTPVGPAPSVCHAASLLLLLRWSWTWLVIVSLAAAGLNHRCTTPISSTEECGDRVLGSAPVSSARL
jgi:hypothetical protein